MHVPWPVRSVCAGAAGTAAMTLAYGAERRLRRSPETPLDFDDSLVPGQIVAGIMHLPHVTDQSEHELGSSCAGATARSSACTTARCAGACRSRGPAWCSAAR